MTTASRSTGHGLDPIPGTPLTEDALTGDALRAAASTFVHTIGAIGLTGLVRAYGDSGVRDDRIRRDRPSLAPGLGSAVDLLLLSRPVPVAEAITILTEPMLGHLLGIGVAALSEDRVRLADTRLVEHLGQFVFVGATNRSGHGYYGPDSVGIGRLLLGSRGRCLDLFSSTGCQASLMAATATAVTAVEIDHTLASLFETNVGLNASPATVRAQWGDARTVEFGGPFDTVCVNAPMMPTFDVLDIPWTGYGGPDGARILEPVLRRVELAARGRLIANAMIPGDRDGLRIDWLRRLGDERGWAVTVIPAGSEELTPDSPFMQRSFARLAISEPGAVRDTKQRLDRVWRAEKIDRLYYGLICVTASATAGLEVASMSLGGTTWRL